MIEFLANMPAVDFVMSLGFDAESINRIAKLISNHMLWGPWFAALSDADMAAARLKWNPKVVRILRDVEAAHD